MLFSFIFLVSICKIFSNLNLDQTQTNLGLPKVDVTNSVIGSVCPPNAISSCVPGKYRSFSGYCNNVDHELWGGTYVQLSRILGPDYADGISQPRQSRAGAAGAAGAELANPVDLSQKLIQSNSARHKQCSMILAQWSQLVYDDIVHLGAARGAGMAPLPCCDSGVQHQECFPLVSGQSGCVPYTRMTPAPRLQCQLGPREQMNMVTSYLDASTIYGSSLLQADKLKDSTTGYLKTTKIPGKIPAEEFFILLSNEKLPEPDFFGFFDGISVEI